jgi:hypothetical protein
MKIGNQIVLSGTASYQFNHFAEYYKKWNAIVESKGDKNKLKNIFPKGVEDGFDWRDYSVMRIPYEILPEGFMDEKQISRSRATHHSDAFTKEFSAIFISDTRGFFRRSLIETCVTDHPILVEGEPVQFKPLTRGNPLAHYIFGVDPASEKDKFSIVIIDVYTNHRRIVYCWTTTRQEYNERFQAKLTDDTEFYGFCARKIRDLMRLFPCEHIAMDSQGGGYAVAEALHDADKLKDGEPPLWIITPSHPLSDKKERITDDYAGLHIIEMVNFVDATWTGEANHGMRKDFEDKILLFPMSNNSEITIQLALETERDLAMNREYDTFEQVLKEIEELKEELASITHTQTPNSNRDHWDTPEIKLEGSRKGRLRKDRYSALLMANAAARRLNRQAETPYQEPYGGFADRIELPKSNVMYTSAPDWFAKPLEGDYDQYGWVAGKTGVSVR